MILYAIRRDKKRKWLTFYIDFIIPYSPKSKQNLYCALRCKLKEIQDDKTAKSAL